MLKCQKHLFQLEEDIHYLNCAYKAPLLRTAEEAAIKALVKMRNPIHLIPSDYFDEAEEARRLFGEIVNCHASEVAIVPSTSYAFSSVLKNINPGKGYHALTIENEFPSDYFSIRRWCDENEAELKIISPNSDLKQLGEDWNEQILNSITEKTAVVILSSIHWMSGLRFDLEKIGRRCKKTGTKLIVDGTQSVGALPMDVKKYQIDALVCASYKWLFGPYSVALAYIGEAFNEGVPLEESWMNRTNAQDFSNLTNYDPIYKPNAGRYNVGQSSKLILMPMLIASLKQINEWTVSGIQEYCRQLIQPLLSYLKSLDIILEHESYFSNHLFSLPLPAIIDGELFKQRLNENKIMLSVRKDKLRISVNVYNTPEDIERLIETVKSVL